MGSDIGYNEADIRSLVEDDLRAVRRHQYVRGIILKDVGSLTVLEGYLPPSPSHGEIAQSFIRLIGSLFPEGTKDCETELARSAYLVINEGQTVDERFAHARKFLPEHAKKSDRWFRDHFQDQIAKLVLNRIIEVERTKRDNVSSLPVGRLSPPPEFMKGTSLKFIASDGLHLPLHVVGPSHGEEFTAPKGYRILAYEKHYVVDRVARSSDRWSSRTLEASIDGLDRYDVNLVFSEGYWLDEYSFALLKGAELERTVAVGPRYGCHVLRFPPLATGERTRLRWFDHRIYGVDSLVGSTAMGQHNLSIERALVSVRFLGGARPEKVWAWTQRPHQPVPPPAREGDELSLDLFGYAEIELRGDEVPRNAGFGIAWEW